MSLRFTRWAWLLVCGALALDAPWANAQTEPQAFTLGFPLNFNFAPPGARAMGLGATFIGLADDATAAAANPAGLTILVEPEVSAHFRLSRVDLEQPGIFATANQLSSERTLVPSYFSVVFPARYASFSVYYLEEAHFKARFVEPTEGRTNLGPFLDPALRALFPGPITFRYTESESVILRQLGLSGAFKLGPMVSVGGSFRFAFADIDADILADFEQPAVTSAFGNYFSERFQISQADNDITFNVGVMVRPTNKFSAGAVYRQGANHTLTTTTTTRFLNQTESTTAPFTAAIPDSYGFGLAVRPTEQLTLALDVARVQYSDLGQGRRPDFPLQDATEVHAGAEYVFFVGSTSTPLSVRGGFYTDPDHDEFDTIRSGEVHGTLGVGVVLRNKYQIDFALNLSERIKESLISFVYRF
jgi:long-chain fatty acid transport protein